MTNAKRHAPATERNRDPILEVLREVLPASGLVLEIASGSGEHAVHFASALPTLTFQSSDPDPDAVASIAAWGWEANLPNLRTPLQLDASADWAFDHADAILCINMIHISPWAATLGLLRNAARILSVGAPLYLYGPYRREGIPTTPSNEAFDQSLKARNPEWGLRIVEDVVAAAAGFDLERLVEMPANNLSLIFRRTPHA